MARVIPGNAPLELVGYGTVVNSGPGTVYYGDDQYVSASANDGQLTAGQTTAISGAMWFVSDATGAEIGIVTSPTLAGVVGGSSQTATSVGALPLSELHRKLWAPSGLLNPAGTAVGDILDISIPDRLAGGASRTPTAGQLLTVGGMVIPAGRTAHGAGFHTAGSAGTGSNVWSLHLFHAVTGAKLASTPDSAAAAVAASTDRSELFSTPYTAQVDTPVILGLLWNGGTAFNVAGITTNVHVHAIGTGPVENGTAGSGYANAAAVPGTLPAVTQAANKVCMWLTTKDAAPAADVSEGLDTTVVIGTVSATKTVLIKPVQFPITVRGVSLVLDNTAVATSDTDYWTVDVGRIPSLSSTFGSIMATKTTQVTGGVAFLTNQAWTFDAVTFTAANQTLVKDDILAIRCTKTGAPTNLQGMVASVRWQVA